MGGPISEIRSRDSALAQLLPECCRVLWAHGHTHEAHVTVKARIGSVIEISVSTLGDGAFALSVWVRTGEWTWAKVFSAHLAPDPSTADRRFFRNLGGRCSILSWKRGWWEDCIALAETKTRSSEALPSSESDPLLTPGDLLWIEGVRQEFIRLVPQAGETNPPAYLEFGEVPGGRPQFLSQADFDALCAQKLARKEERTGDDPTLRMFRESLTRLLEAASVPKAERPFKVPPIELRAELGRLAEGNAGGGRRVGPRVPDGGYMSKAVAAKQRHRRKKVDREMTYITTYIDGDDPSMANFLSWLLDASPKSNVVQKRLARMKQGRRLGSSE